MTFITDLGSRGRMLMLLKEKNKVSVSQKSRKKYQALLPTKRFKGMSPDKMPERSLNSSLVDEDRVSATPKRIIP